MENKELKAIEIGKIWMKNSLDPVHDFGHCERVEKHALEILKYFKKLDSTLDENLVKLAVWWHDSYKARQKKSTFVSIFFEGPLSCSIFKSEVGQLVMEDRSRRVLSAIRYHANPLYFTIFKMRMDPLVNILVEADQAEGFNVDRNMKFLKQLKNPISKLLGYLQCLMVPIYMKLISRSEYSKKFLNLKSI